MTNEDFEYIRSIANAGLIRDPVLELGTGWGGLISKPIVEKLGFRHVGTDLEEGPGVDIAADFESADDVARVAARGPFGTVLVLNVLEHTFDPIRILDQAVTLARPGGTVVALTPSVWPLHNFPMDAWRILPNFHEVYALRRKLHLSPDWHHYIGFGPVASFRDESGNYIFPPPSRTAPRHRYGRIVHKLFNTFGRSMRHPSHIATAAVFEIGERQSQA